MGLAREAPRGLLGQAYFVKRAKRLTIAELVAECREGSMAANEVGSPAPDSSFQEMRMKILVSS